MESKNKQIIKALGEYSSFILKFTSLTRKSTSEMSIWEHIKLLYYILFKYRRLHSKIQSVIKTDIHTIANRPENFIEIIVSYIYVIEVAKTGYPPQPDKFMDTLLNIAGSKDKITITTTTNPQGQLSKYKVTVFGISPIDLFQKDKVCKSILDIDIIDGKYSLDFTAYDLDTIDTQQFPIDSKIIYRKIFQIQPDGKIYNPNFKFDIELEAQETMEYIWSCLFTISPLLSIIAGFTSLEFIGYKKE